MAPSPATYTTGVNDSASAPATARARPRGISRRTNSAAATPDSSADTRPIPRAEPAPTRSMSASKYSGSG